MIIIIPLAWNASKYKTLITLPFPDPVLEAAVARAVAGAAGADCGLPGEADGQQRQGVYLTHLFPPLRFRN